MGKTSFKHLYKREWLAGRRWAGASLMLVTLGASPALAQWQASAGATAAYFHYEERATGGRTLNTERGTLPGLQLSLGYELLRGSRVRLTGTRYAEDVRYRGMTQGGRPLNTRTDTVLSFVDAELELAAFRHNQWDVTPVLQAGYRQWQRHILPTGNVRGLEEVYQWYQVGAGVSACHSLGFWVFERGCARALAGYSFEGDVVVNLKAFSAGEPSLRLGSKPGGALEVSVQAAALEISLFSRYWQFGRSKPVTVNRPAGQLSIEEPASQSWLTGISARYRF